MSPRAEALASNLWRWTTPHPLWRPGDDERAGGSERDVGSFLYARDGTVTIIAARTRMPPRTTASMRGCARSTACRS